MRGRRKCLPAEDVGGPHGYLRFLECLADPSDEEHVEMLRWVGGALSFGSEVTMWVATHSNLLAAAFVTSPCVTPISYQMNGVRGDMFTNGLRKVWGLGSPEETPEQWKRLSPVYSIDDVHPPVLFQMSEEGILYAVDYIFPLMLRHRADLYVVPNETHRKFQPRHMLAAYERNLDWFRFWLQGMPGKRRNTLAGVRCGDRLVMRPRGHVSPWRAKNDHGLCFSALHRSGELSGVKTWS